MEKNKQQVIERLETASNVLVTVSRDPSVDQLAACIGFTLLLNKMGKHATAVFSGRIPSALEFLQPEQTLEANTDSLRDFIISLDTTKADRLRYKVEDNLVKIFITPYRTSISQDDLVFSQGDFNVDVVMALGVQERSQLDEAITSHGRILHDATVISVNTGQGADLGSIHWSDERASSLCEMLTHIADSLKKDLLDAQSATALLTGIVAETERFSNDKTTSNTMGASAKLMTAGANQQLVATKLQEQNATASATDLPEPETDKADDDQDQASSDRDGSIKIDHKSGKSSQKSGKSKKKKTKSNPDNSQPGDETELEIPRPLGVKDNNQADSDSTKDSKRSDDEPGDGSAKEESTPTSSQRGRDGRMVLQPPTLGSKLTANTEPESVADTNPLALPPVDGGKLLKRSQPKGSSQPKKTLDELLEEESLKEQAKKPSQELPMPDPRPLQQVDESPTDTAQPKSDKQSDQSLTHESLADLEKNLADSTPQSATPPDPDEARKAIDQAIMADDQPRPEPIAALGSQPVELKTDDDKKTDLKLRIDPKTGKINYSESRADDQPSRQQSAAVATPAPDQPPLDNNAPADPKSPPSSPSQLPQMPLPSGPPPASAANGHQPTTPPALPTPPPPVQPTQDNLGAPPPGPPPMMPPPHG